MKIVDLTGKVPAQGQTSSQSVLAAGMRMTLEALLAKGYEITVFDPLPGAPTAAPRAAAMARQTGFPTPEPYTLNEFTTLNTKLFDVLRDMEGRGVKRVKLWEDLCRTGRCEYIRDGRPIYSDQNHPTLDGLNSAFPSLAKRSAEK